MWAEVLTFVEGNLPLFSHFTSKIKRTHGFVYSSQDLIKSDALISVYETVSSIRESVCPKCQSPCSQTISDLKSCEKTEFIKALANRFYLLTLQHKPTGFTTIAENVTELYNDNAQAHLPSSQGIVETQIEQDETDEFMQALQMMKNQILTIFESFSPAEQKVLKLILEGKSKEEICKICKYKRMQGFYVTVKRIVHKAKELLQNPQGALKLNFT